MRGLSLVLASLVLLAVANEAAAAGRPYAYTLGVEGLPESGVELEFWFSFDEPRDAAEGPTLDWWIGPVVGVLDELEVGIFGIFVQPPDGDHAGASLGLGAMRLQVSYLPVPVGSWPVDLRFRLEFEYPVGAGNEDRSSPNIWLTIIGSYDLGPVNFTLNIGGLVEIERDGPSPWLVFNGAISVEIVGGLRLGVEDFGEYIFDDKIVENSVGPTIGFGIGRVWTAGTFGFGTGSDSAKYQGRIVIGLAF